MSEELKDSQTRDLALLKIKGIKPVGASTVTRHKMFSQILERVVLGQSPTEVADWVNSQSKKQLRASAIETYFITHLPHLIPIDEEPQESIIEPEPIAEETAAEVFPEGLINAITELEIMYTDICNREIGVKSKLSDRDIHWGGALKDIQDEKIKILSALNIARSEQRKLMAYENSLKVKTADNKNNVQKWTPEFAKAVAEMITRNLSVLNGDLRRFQGKTIEDGE